MEIHPVSTIKPAYKGSVHKSIKKYTRKVVFAEIDKCISGANCRHELINDTHHSPLDMTAFSGHEFLQKIQEFMKPQHKNSSVKLNSMRALEISNPICKQSILIFRTPFKNSEFGLKSAWVSNTAIGCPKSVGKPGYTAVLTLVGINFSQIKTRFKARLIEKFAKECDLKTTVKQDAEKYIMQAKEKMPSLEPTNLSGKIKHIINVRRNNNQTSRYYKNQWLHYIGKRRTYLKEY